MADPVTWRGFRGFVFEVDRFDVESFDSEWPLEKQACLGQQKTIDERKRAAIIDKFGPNPNKCKNNF